MKPPFDQPGRTECATAEDTRAFGKQLGASLEAGDMVILDGPLGAGKTTLTQGIAQGMGVKGRVTSPTFIIAREHKNNGDGPALVHVDAYRLLDSVGGTGTADPLGELDALDLDSELEDAVVVTEWGGGLVEQLTSRYLVVTLNRDALDEGRVISWAPAG
ncbi:tRNA (adenosine(37)-N6)-threonylcarbamoyltransferase complex ATPase subunit type 1 TsaE [Corynebacterium sp. CCUG 71335]|uniref:tRNA (adenosine(37)-N6)-threonylcarbamoyltransferase complex ATPase subunit type 1 TsaE n=1 Tax=Corynebacterium sp. CCUG 71335 TaxID=2823892 RepID=UPI00210AD962|nr:tRNA (adenosine(37)-N6)-threonylcarbamoyltransferase complex ATPase subunit type 1 TsaE [Corynebacterium sp. CCUG 71335]MCQ4620969.1 tRNA (adenosine(37)-N6)-threonylcarbamoyltransferase complex ATPase subunit type 1 TsaE [Corynebacterium sp. CCUG 71335]